MGRRLIFSPQVPGDLLKALSYYDAISEDLGNRFRDRVDIRFDDIERSPESFPLDEPPTRCALISGFPYLILFADFPDHILVTAVVHAASDPGEWRRPKN